MGNKVVCDYGNVFAGNGITYTIQPALCALCLVSQCNSEKNGFDIIAVYKATIRIVITRCLFPVGNCDIPRRERKFHLIYDIIAFSGIVVSSRSAADIIVFITQFRYYLIFTGMYGMRGRSVVFLAYVRLTGIQICEHQVIMIEGACKRHGSIRSLAIVCVHVAPHVDRYLLGKNGKINRALILIIVGRFRDIYGKRIATCLGGLYGRFAAVATVFFAVICCSRIDIRYRTVAGVGKIRLFFRVAIRPTRIENKSHFKLCARYTIPKACYRTIFGYLIYNMRSAFALLFKDAGVPTIVVKIVESKRQPIGIDGCAVFIFKNYVPGRAAFTAFRYIRLPNLAFVKLIRASKCGYRYNELTNCKFEYNGRAAEIIVFVDGNGRFVNACGRS